MKAISRCMYICALLTIISMQAMEQQETEAIISKMYTCKDRGITKDILYEYYGVKKADIKQLDEKPWQKAIKQPKDTDTLLLLQKLYQTTRNGEDIFILKTSFCILQNAYKSNSLMTDYSKTIDKEISAKKALQLMVRLALYHSGGDEPDEVYCHMHKEGKRLLLQHYKEQEERIDEQQQEMKELQKSKAKLQKKLKKQEERITGLSFIYQKQAEQIASLKKLLEKASTKLDKAKKKSSQDAHFGDPKFPDARLPHA
jgi:hypothetical protein